uniref:Uncharacterized protein n=1 Tax=Biomphalaria glabrata TaxID=6526 RepID=A0A182YU16_BIOGL
MSIFKYLICDNNKCLKRIIFI